MKTLTTTTIALTLLLSSALYASVPCEDLFQTADTSSDGILDSGEIAAYCDFDSTCVTNLENADVDGDGGVSYEEFMAAGLCSEI